MPNRARHAWVVALVSLTSSTAAFGQEKAEAPAEQASEGQAAVGGGSEDGGPFVGAELAAYGGVGVRLDDEASLQTDQRAGLAGGVGFAMWPSAALGIGLAVESRRLGLASFRTPDGSSGEVTRGLTSLWFDIFVRVFDNDAAAIDLHFGPGFVWQSAETSAAIVVNNPNAEVVTIACEGSDGPDIGLRLGGRGSLRFNEVLSGFMSVLGEGSSSSDDPIDVCVRGAGTPLSFVTRVGLVARWDWAADKESE